MVLFYNKYTRSNKKPFTFLLSKILKQIYFFLKTQCLHYKNKLETTVMCARYQL